MTAVCFSFTTIKLLKLSALLTYILDFGLYYCVKFDKILLTTCTCNSVVIQIFKGSNIWNKSKCSDLIGWVSWFESSCMRFDLIILANLWFILSSQKDIFNRKFTSIMLLFLILHCIMVCTDVIMLWRRLKLYILSHV